MAATPRSARPRPARAGATPPRGTARRATAAAVGATVAGSLVVVVVTAQPAGAATTDTLSLGQTLTAGQSLVSSDGRFRLAMQGDGNLVQYAGTAVRWQTRTDGHPGSRLAFQGDGNVVLVDAASRPLWWTDTWGPRKATRLVMQSDGNEVAYNAAGAWTWQSDTVQAATPAPGPTPGNAGPWTSPSGRFVAALQGDGNFVMSYRGSATPDPLFATFTDGHPRARLVLQGDGNLVIYDGSTALWASRTDGHPGATARMQDDGNFVIYAGAQPLWSTLTSNVAAGIGAPGDSRFALSWSHALNNAAPALGSPGVGTLDGAGPSVIVGTTGGVVYAHHVSDGGVVAGWPRYTGIVVQSTPSVSGSGPSAGVFVGLGSAAQGNNPLGGVVAYNGDGSDRWRRGFTGRPDGSQTTGVQGSVAVGALQDPVDVVSGSMDQMQFAFAAASGVTLFGWPWFAADSSFTTPAIVSRLNQNVIVEGGDSTAGVALGRTYTNGGHIRIVSAQGHGPSGNAGDGVICSDDTNQVVQGSPAVGNFLAGGYVGIVSGTGTYWGGASDTNTVLADDLQCHRVWQTRLDGSTGASPSLIDVDGDGVNDVVEGTNASTNPSPGQNGSVYVLDAASGRVKRQIGVRGNVYGSITSVDLGNGHQTLVVPTSYGVYLVDAVSGGVSPLVEAVGVQNTATVTRDPDGRVGITVAGYNGIGRFVEMHFVLRSSNVATVSGRGQWPMFHHDPQLTGVAYQ